MLNLTDFKKSNTAYILVRHNGHCHKGIPILPEIKEIEVLSVGKKYVTVSNGKKFKRQGDIEGLIEHSEFGELGELFTTRAAAENEIERDRLMKEIRQNMRFMFKLTTEELKEINEMLCKERLELK